MALVAFVIALALIEYLAFGVLTGRARVQAGVKAPATTGDPNFERHFRVQQNTLEQLIIFVPSMLLFGLYVSHYLAALLGLAFILGRFLYYRAYVEDPEKRTVGFLTGEIGLVILLIGGAVGALVAWL
jgi:uncharacterized MAPEG superfamily protein